MWHTDELVDLTKRTQMLEWSYYCIIFEFVELSLKVRTELWGTIQLNCEGPCHAIYGIIG